MAQSAQHSLISKSSTVATIQALPNFLTCSATQIASCVATTTAACRADGSVKNPCHSAVKCGAADAARQRHDVPAIQSKTEATTAKSSRRMATKQATYTAGCRRVAEGDPRSASEGDPCSASAVSARSVPVTDILTLTEACSPARSGRPAQPGRRRRQSSSPSELWQARPCP